MCDRRIPTSAVWTIWGFKYVSHRSCNPLYEYTDLHTIVLWSGSGTSNPRSPRAARPLLPRYCLFVFGVNGLVVCIYLCSWHLMNGGTILYYIGLILLFSLQSAILSVILEWKRPIRNWKTESDLWHNPRKYIVPLIMLILASFISTWAPTIWIWLALLLIECCVLLYFTRRD